MVKKKSTAKRPGTKKSAPPRGKTPRRQTGARKTSRRARPSLPSAALSEIVGRALTDAEFRELLFTDRKRAVRGMKLNDADRSALDRLTPDMMREHAERLGGRASLTVKVVISKSF